VEYVQNTLKELGIEPERVRMFNLSSAMGPRFAEIATEMTAQTAAMGSSPVNTTKSA
jgi:coenzyme F420-reducing hydrogenase delta subunit